MTTLKLTTAIETSDGSLFKDELSARNHELSLVKNQLTEHIDTYCSTAAAYVSTQDIRSYIINNWSEISLMMNQIWELSGGMSET